MALVDTSVWINHFRKTIPRLKELLNEGEVAIHPFVIGELACGNLANRKEILSLLHALATAPRIEDDEILFFQTSVNGDFSRKLNASKDRE